jgi:autophagy-related protein 9
MISNEGKMEKSFLNFKATNPDWNPTDPSGSLYLNRMADLTHASAGGPGHGLGPGGSALPFNPRDPHSIAHLYRRRHFREQPPNQPVPGVFADHVHFATSNVGVTSPTSLSTSVHLPQVANEEGGGKSLAEKAQEYDWALKQSQNMAAARRTSKGLGTSMFLAGSAAGLGASAGAASVYSAAKAEDLAKTVVLEDSHIDSASTPVQKNNAKESGKGEIGEEDEMIGGSGLGLNESELYVDGAKRERMGYGDGQDGGFDVEGEKFLEEDGGVLGLLAQVYGRRDGAVRGI